MSVDAKTNLLGDGISIAHRDKMLMHIQDQLACKKNQIKIDYKQLKQSVDDNPYLQVAIDEYEKYFAIEKQQIKALKDLLRQVESISHTESISHRHEIKKAIADLEKNAL